VLVATSIGEEGLDIGEVDLIVCYDAQKTPIRMVVLFLHFQVCVRAEQRFTVATFWSHWA
jgi:hypothetical protein